VTPRCATRLTRKLRHLASLADADAAALDALVSARRLVPRHRLNELLAKS
jgi:hypothetical protein